MVVAGAAAGGRGVAEPVAVLLADRVGVVGEGRGALVGGDDEVRVVAVDAHHLRRRHDRGAGEVVGEVEQGAQVVLVAGDAFLHVGVAVRRRRRLLQHEAALRAHRDDDGVLHHLRLHQAEHLGAEVLRPVRPAQPAARDLAAAQVDALEARRVDEDLVQRPGLGQPGHLGRVELEAEEAAARPGAPVWPTPVRQKLVRSVAWISASSWRSTRSSDRLATFSSACSIALTCAAAPCSSRLSGSKRSPKSAYQHARDARVRAQRRLDRRLREREADLLQVLGVGAQHHDLVGARGRRAAPGG